MRAAIENENFADIWLEHLEEAAARIGVFPAPPAQKS